jgi:hypothetical protein
MPTGNINRRSPGKGLGINPNERTNDMTHLIDLPAFNATHAAPNRSDRYTFYSTKELIQTMLDDDWNVTQAFQVRSRQTNPYAKHLVRLTHPKLQLGGDRLEAIIRNSHDGSSRIEFSLGAWRMVCENGIIIGSSYATFAIQHTKAFEQVKERANELIEHAPEVSAVFDAWKAKELTNDEERALAVAAAMIRWPKADPDKLPVDPRELLVVRREEDKGDNLWSVFNRLQESVMTGGTIHVNDRRRTRRIGSIDETLRINKALWRAAEGLYGATTDVALPS